MKRHLFFSIVLSAFFTLFLGLASAQHTNQLVDKYVFIAQAKAQDSPSEEEVDKTKIPNKLATNKFIYLSNVGVDFGKKKGFDYFYISFSRSDKNNTIESKMEYAETHRDNLEETKSSKEQKNKKEKLITEEDDDKKEENTTFGNTLYKSLKSVGYIDTVNRVFQDENNTLVLECTISKINIFTVTGYANNPCCQNCYKAKVFLKWYIENRYGEILDSMVTTGISDNFYRDPTSYGFSIPSKRMELMVGSAVESSFLKLYNADFFKKRFTTEPIPVLEDAVLHITKPKSIVATKSDAASASVIIKRDDQGHGSGFAISQDGYILTNYHVISTKNPSKTEKIKVLTSGGQELEATVVRFSKARDIALLKVNATFEKAFLLSNEKKFQNLQDVYTIGAPKSIELGQTMSTGIVSNERNTNNNELLQLSMPVNFGNSGGPLFDHTGFLHGVIIAKLVGRSTEGISFAIPAYKIGDYLKLAY